LKRLLAGLLTIAMLGGAAAAEEPQVEYKEVVTQTATVTAERVNIRSGPGTKYGIAATGIAGETYTVIRPYDDWYQIELSDGTLACIHKDYVSIEETVETVAVVKEPELEASVSRASMPTMLKRKQPHSLQGMVTSNVPMTGIRIVIRNDNRLSREQEAQVQFDSSENVLEYDLHQLDSQLSFSSLVSGEKTLSVTVTTAAQTRTIFTHSFTVLGGMEDTISLNNKCNFAATYGNVSVLTDGYTGTIWRPSSASSKITITLPADAEPGAFTIAWDTVPTAFTVTCRDGSGNVAARFDRSNSYDMLVNFWGIDTSVRTIEVVLQDTGSGICEMKVLQDGRISPVQQNWTPTPEKLDMMLISTHQDDEWLFFAGALPDSVDRGKDVAVLYMANCNRMRYGEALAGLWHGGLRNYPIFLNLEDYYAGSFDQALKRWGEETTLKLLVQSLRRYKPDVVLTHDFDGEYANNQHKVTAWAVARAVELAQDPTYDPASAEEYGVWEVKKLYIHLYKENAIYMDWDRPLAAFDGRTGLEMATIGFNMHYLIQDDYTIDYGKKYDYTCFGLYYSAVGPDVEKNYFFENIVETEDTYAES